MLRIRQKIVNELKSEINWRTFEAGGILKRGYNKSISSSIYMYLQAAINISFQVVLTFV